MHAGVIEKFQESCEVRSQFGGRWTLKVGKDFWGAGGGKVVILGREPCMSRGTVEIKGIFSGNPFCSQHLALDLE